MERPQQPYRISKIAVVVNDIDAAMNAYQKALGWGPWQVSEHAAPKLHDQQLRGKPSDYTMIGAKYEVQPGLVFELVQPLEGDSIYQEHLERHGEGVHHIAFIQRSSRESDALKERFIDAGYPVTMSGRIGETIEFFYLDTEPLLHFVAESVSGKESEITPSGLSRPTDNPQ
jgi:methylmalonyl-CoA/ethylmalonyl-CoA epimerase